MPACRVIGCKHETHSNGYCTKHTDDRNRHLSVYGNFPGIPVENLRVGTFEEEEQAKKTREKTGRKCRKCGHHLTPDRYFNCLKCAPEPVYDVSMESI